MPDKLHRDLIGADLHNGIAITGAGNPNGVVTASAVGEHYFDTQSSIKYTATAADSTSWAAQIGANGFRQVTCPASTNVYDLVRITGNDTVDKAGKDVPLGTADAVVVAKINATTALVTASAHNIAGLGSLSLNGGDRIYLGNAADSPNYATLAQITVGQIQQEVGKMWNTTEATVNIDQSEIIL